MAAMTEESIQLYRDAEQSVLGALIADAPLNAADVFSRVKAEDFITGDYRYIFETCRKMFVNNDTVDPITVRSACGTEYISLIKKLADMMPSPWNCKSYVRQLLDCSKRTQIDALLRETLGHVTYSSPIPEIAAKVQQMENVLARESESRGSDMSDLLFEFFNNWDEKPKFLDWGFPSVTRATQTELGQYVIIAAEPSAGKTAYALNAAQTLAAKNRVVFYTLEMSRERLMQRIMARTALVDLNKIKAHEADPDEWEAIVHAKSKLINLPFRIVEAHAMTAEEIRADAIRSHAEVIIVDYLQLIPPSNPRMSEYDTITANTKALQQLARTGICVVALSQLSNEGKLRGSRQINQDADVVLRIGIPDKDKLKTPEQLRAFADDSLRVVKIAKNRDGSRITLPFWFEGKYQRFVEEWNGFYTSKIEEMKEPQPEQVHMPGA
ncbi:replicative DNA helicase [Agathobaculum sp. NTUH-O15-33]|uniref:replicative DNA helicase n=1 Tax=Agathobaculum sp. NTUH-O15-33 TaxID=3079302 RepID=UPI00295858FB|nr:replicative DNA helicase [Agathobaculum sp. NTUH-O15-33]WNX85766.1 replicative DNA helicase [Agathobaculum sp. NTUH-O15-33]